MTGLPVDAYRACYGDCRTAGGDIAECMSRCGGLMPGDTGVSVYDDEGSCAGFWDCFWADLPGTVHDVAGGAWSYGERAIEDVTGAVQRVTLPLAAIVVGGLVFYLLLFRR